MDEIPVCTQQAQAWIDGWVADDATGERDRDCNDCWMNFVAAKRQKGAPLSVVEVRRILVDGGSWHGGAGVGDY